MGSTSFPQPLIRWEPRVPPDLIHHLYQADASGLPDPELIDEVGYALFMRCETIRRVTERCCPSCGQRLLGTDGEDRQRVISCPDCQWHATWAHYLASYKRDRIHGGRAYPAFTAYLAEFPRCRTPQDKMLCIDRLIHGVHLSLDHSWTTPAAVNLIQAKRPEIERLLDGLAGNPAAGEERRRVREEYLRHMASGRVVRERQEAEIRQRHLLRGLDFGRGPA